jgi:transglutaminase-like putative cysteine protease
MARRREAMPDAMARPTPDARGRYRLRPEWVRAGTAIDVGLIVLGVYILQAFLSTNAADVSARIAILAWALAIPLLALLALLDYVQEGFRYVSNPLYLQSARGLATGAGVVGFVAAVWHLWIAASLVLIASGLLGLTLFRIYARRLERDNSV